MVFDVLDGRGVSDTKNNRNEQKRTKLMKKTKQEERPQFVSGGFEVQGDAGLIDSVRNEGELGVQQESKLGQDESTDGM